MAYMVAGITPDEEINPSDIFCTKSAMRENADPKGAVVVILLDV